MENFKYRADDKVVIRCPNPKKYSRFAAAFDGKRAVVQRVAIHGELILAIDEQQINVAPSWVGRVK